MFSSSMELAQRQEYRVDKFSEVLHIQDLQSHPRLKFVNGDRPLRSQPAIGNYREKHFWGRLRILSENICSLPGIIRSSVRDLGRAGISDRLLRFIFLYYTSTVRPCNS